MCGQEYGKCKRAGVREVREVREREGGGVREVREQEGGSNLRPDTLYQLYSDQHQMYT